MRKRNLFNKYNCDNKLKIYSDLPLNNYQYKRMIENARPRYLNEYYNAPKFSRKKDEKNFNKLLNSYYSDYRRLKNKYNFIPDESEKEEYQDGKNNNMNYDEYVIKKRNLNILFGANGASDLDDINFDLTDKLINSMYNGKNDTLLKNTQTKDDYNLRLNGIRIEQEDENTMKEKEDNKEGDILEKDEYINEKEEQKEEIKKENNNEEEDYITNNKNKEEEQNLEEEEIPILDNDNLVNNEDNYLVLKDNNNQEDFPMFKEIINHDYNKEYNPPCYEKPIEKEGKENEENKENEEEEYNDFDYKEEGGANDKDKEENILQLINKNKVGKDKKLDLVEDIISNDFKGNYEIPTYKIPKNIEKEIEEEKERKEKEKEKEIYENNKNPNIVISEEKVNQKLEEIINSNTSPKNEEEKKIENVDDKDDNADYDGAFVEGTTLVEKKEEEKKNYDEFKDKEIDFKTANEMVQKTNNEEEKVKRSKKYNEDEFDDVIVDDFNDFEE